MMATRTRSWLQFSAAGILFSLGSCSSESIAPQLPIDDAPGAMVGELVVYIANFDDGTAETRYFLKQVTAPSDACISASSPTLRRELT